MLDEMVDNWEEVYWYEHVCNESVPEVLGLVTQSADLFQRELSYLVPSNSKEIISTDTHRVSVDIQSHHIMAVLTPKGAEEW